MHDVTQRWCQVYQMAMSFQSLLWYTLQGGVTIKFHTDSFTSLIVMNEYSCVVQRHEYLFYLFVKRSFCILEKLVKCYAVITYCVLKGLIKM